MHFIFSHEFSLQQWVLWKELPALQSEFIWNAPQKPSRKLEVVCYKVSSRLSPHLFEEITGCFFSMLSFFVGRAGLMQLHAVALCGLQPTQGHLYLRTRFPNPLGFFEQGWQNHFFLIGRLLCCESSKFPVMLPKSNLEYFFFFIEDFWWCVVGILAQML